MFVNMVANMGISNNRNFLSNTDTLDDPLEKIIDKYKNRPSITCINIHIANSGKNMILHVNLPRKIRLVNNKTFN